MKAVHGREATPAEQRAYDLQRSGRKKDEARTPAIDWSSLSGKDPPSREWAIDHWLGMGHVTLLSGLGGIGKSLLSQQMASTLCLGLPFLDTVPMPRKVLLWAGEDDETELWRRQHAIARTMQVDLSQFQGELFVHAMDDQDCTLMDSVYGEMMPTGVVDQLTAQVNDYKADVVILDNISRLFGGSENNRHDVTSFMSLLMRAGGERKPAILLLGHVSKAVASEFSGSTAWENAVRSRLWFSDKKPDEAPSETEEQADPTIRYLARRKANYSAKDMRVLHYAEGAFSVERNGIDTGIIGAIGKRNAERVIIRGIAAVEKLGHTPSDSPCANYLPKLLMEYRLNDGFSKADLTSAMKRVIGDGTVTRRPERTGNRSSERIRLVAKEYKQD